MEYLRVAEGRGSPKREFRSVKGRINNRNLRNNLLESIAQSNGGSVVSQAANEDGVVRMKILVKKQDLKQMLELVRNGSKNNSYQSSSSSFSSVEQRLNLLRRKHLLRVNAGKESRRRSAWIPALQSIPEEF
ncbi:hypothetical protein JCGZ_13071 [Jatropha curcas]|uniref:Uncharacterized protein n=1 Tax=Jatropha curcas TaxID=180498 RepID=A0A067KNB0_JATCU|nr:hypothetical protein JCGZ_13071 [Jatropha curcas]